MEAAKKEVIKTPLAKQAAEFIKIQEGFTPISQGDFKQISWGYGTKAKALGKRISEAEAEKELYIEIAPLLVKIKDYNISDNAKISLVSFGFNVGIVPFNLMLDRIKKQGWTLTQIAARMQQYNLAGGKVLDGLVDRRKIEGKLLLA
jgi:GH24 family phage-related lysozyme (muramidase)